MSFNYLLGIDLADSIASYTAVSMERTPYPRIHGLTLLSFYFNNRCLSCERFVKLESSYCLHWRKSKEALFLNSIFLDVVRSYKHNGYYLQ